jgi:cytoskeletal protein RodZ
MAERSLPDQSLGQYLRAARESRGYTIEQIASATKISVKTLMALEADDYVHLPAKPFVRGFVVAYARFMGIDQKDILSQFNSYLEERSHDRPSRDAGHSGYAFEKKENDQSRTVLGVVLGVFVLIGAGVFIVVKPKLHHKKKTSVERLITVEESPRPTPVATLIPGPGVAMSAGPSTVGKVQPTPKPSPVLNSSDVAIPVASPQPTPAEAQAAKRTPDAEVAKKPEEKILESASSTHSSLSAPQTPTPPQPNPKDPLNSGFDLKSAQVKQKVVFRALESVWVRYRVDQRPMMKFILRKDRVLVLRGQEAIWFQVSNPEHLNYNLNGRGFRNLSQSKSVEKKTSGYTWIVPTELAKPEEDPFPGEKVMGSPPPPPPQSDAVSTQP